MKSLMQQVKRTLSAKNINQQDMMFIVKSIENQISDIPLLRKSLEKFIDYISKKYNISLTDIYAIDNKIWNHIIIYRFYNINTNVSGNLKNTKGAQYGIKYK